MISDVADGRKGLFLLTGSSDIFRSAQVQEALLGHMGHMAQVERYPLSLAERSGGQHNLIDWLFKSTFEKMLMKR